MTWRSLHPWLPGICLAIFTFGNVRAGTSDGTYPVDTLELIACAGDSAWFDGVAIPAGQTQQFALGADSVVTVIVKALPIDHSQLELIACPDSTVDYNGHKLPPHSITDFVFQNQYGCDSVVTVSVAKATIYKTIVKLQVCPGESAAYNGQWLPAGTGKDFVLDSYYGCDSIVKVSVTALPIDTTAVELFACSGDSAQYGGQALAAGTTSVFVYQNHSGCDSVVTVQVTPLSRQFVTLKIHACSEKGVNFAGQTLFPGEKATAVFQNQNGCDSTVTAIVFAYPASDTGKVTLMSCANGTAWFHGNPLSPGSEQAFIFPNHFGCDSVVQVRVGVFPPLDFELTASGTCWNASDGFIEVELPGGSSQPFDCSLDGVNFQREPDFGGLPGGEYKVSLRDGNGCVFSKNIEVPVTERLAVSLGDYVLPCHEPGVKIGPEIINPGTGSLRWRWENGSTEPWCEATQAGTYAVEVSDDCSTERLTYGVAWGNDVPATYLYVPNAFSPNGDGTNESFQAYSLNPVDFQTFELKVFDRWGNQLFETGNPETGWDGTFRGKPVDTGVYAWFLKTKVFACGRVLEVFKRGDLTLLR
jgi:gliding motility-associated-like protein